MRPAVAYAWYRLRATRRSEVSYLLTVVLLIATVGGLSMAAVAAARSTESSFTDYVAASHVSQLFVLDGVINPSIGLDSAYNPALLRTLAHLPHVQHVASTVELNMGPLSPGNHPEENTSSISAEASVGGLDFTEDPVTMASGRLPDPQNPDEFAIDAASAKALGYHLGQSVHMGWVTNTQVSSGDTPASAVIPPDQRASLKLVGIGNGQATTLFQDQDSASQGTIMLFTPALTNKLLECCSNDMVSALTLRGGNRYLPVVEQEVRHALPAGLPFVYVESQQILATADATLRPEAIALGVFGGIAGLATLLICGQVVSRRIRLKSDELDVTRALGADPSMTLWDGLLGTLGAVVIGSALAMLVALALSPLAPLGPVRPYLRSTCTRTGPCSAWAQLGSSSRSALVAAVASLRARPDGRRDRQARVPSSPRDDGCHARRPATRRGGGRPLRPRARRRAQRRSRALGHPRRHPRCHGGRGHGHLRLQPQHTRDAPGALRVELDLRHRRRRGAGRHPRPGGGQAARRRPAGRKAGRASTTRPCSSTAQRARSWGRPRAAAVAPPLLSGHALDSANQVVLGAGTLRQLHKQVGDTVVVRAQHGAPVTLTIVGTATLPPLGVAGSSHLEMGTGAVLDYHLIPPADRNLFE